MFHFFFCAFGIELTIQMGLEMAFTLEPAAFASREKDRTHNMSAMDFYHKNIP